MVEREFTETVTTPDEGGTKVSKLFGRFCVASGGVTLGGRVGTKSKGGGHRRCLINNVVQRSVGLMVAVENTSC